MGVEEYRSQQEIERLRTAVLDAINYLRLMPVAPVTHHKIADLEKALQSPPTTKALHEAKPWKQERRTPKGECLELAFRDGLMCFRSEVALPKDAQVEWALTGETQDLLIEALIAERYQLKRD